MADDKDKDKKDSATDSAAERRTIGAKKPNKPGEKDGEERDGYVWDKGINDWRDNRGVDFTADPSLLPLGFEHVGDGSPEKPHQVRQQGRWS